MNIPFPIAMLAELTHICPLACPYCSNPLELTKRQNELDTQIWVRVFQEAAKLGVLQLHLSGGEPASRRDLVELTQAAHDAGLYTNLITSGIGLSDEKLEALNQAGLDHIQISLQGINAGIADHIGGYKGGFDRKMALVNKINAIGFPLTINAVMHRANMDDLPNTLEMAKKLRARRVEVACVQMHGWAVPNRSAILPTREQVAMAKSVVAKARQDYAGQMVIDFVPPDYYSDYPKACMGGWASTGFNITPSGEVLPCHAAETIQSLSFENVRDKSLEEIWYHSEAFMAFRGEEWMPETCKNCERKALDFGGCRCQALAITGNVNAVDPVCRKSPDRAKVDALIEDALGSQQAEYIYRERA